MNKEELQKVFYKWVKGVGMEEKEKYECLERTFKEYQAEFAKQQTEISLIKCGNEQLKKENEQLKQELGNYKLLNAVFGEDKNEAVAREKLIKNQKIVMDGFAKQLCEEQQTVKQLKQQLAEKEELLKNVNNDFKIGDTVYVIRKLKQDIRCGRIEYIWDGNHKNNWRRYRVNLPKVNSVTKLKHELFATKAEAQKKLEGIKNV